MIVSFALACAHTAPKPAPAGNEALAGVIREWSDGEGPRLEIPADLSDRARAVGIVGRHLWQMDIATARGSDALGVFAQKDPRWAKVYLARPVAGERADECCFEVHFPALLDGTPAKWLTATAGWYREGSAVFDPNFQWVGPDGTPVDLAAHAPDTLQIRLPEAEPYDEDMARRVRVLRSALAAVPPLPWNSYNTAVLSFEDLGEKPDLRVYLIPASTDPDLVLVSGWIWWDVAAGSEALGPAQRYGTGPIVSSRKDMPKDLELFSVFATSTSGPVPTEAHVFAALSYDVVLFVLTEAGLWRVAGDDVALVAPPP